MKEGITIAVSGKSGCGNSTVSKLVAKELGLRLVNYTFHTIAEERGMDFEELCRLAETDSSWDYYLDDKQRELSAAGNCVLGSRLAIWLLKDADLKVFLDAPLEVRAGRIAKREGKTLEAALEKTRLRDKRDRERYLRLYGIDNDKHDFADIVIDTTAYTPEEEAEIIIRNALARSKQ